MTEFLGSLLIGKKGNLQSTDKRNPLHNWRLPQALGFSLSRTLGSGALCGIANACSIPITSLGGETRQRNANNATNNYEITHGTSIRGLTDWRPFQYPPLPKHRSMKDREREQSDNEKPVPYKAVRVWLPNGTRTLGMWTGSRWWSTKGEINPVKWELEVRKKKKSEKILKKLPKSERPTTEADEEGN
jgi:hypothetical protein